MPRHQSSTLFPYTTLFRSLDLVRRPIVPQERGRRCVDNADLVRSEEHTSELQSRFELVCRLQLEKKNNPTAISIQADAKLALSAIIAEVQKRQPRPAANRP